MSGTRIDGRAGRAPTLFEAIAGGIGASSGTARRSSERAVTLAMRVHAAAETCATALALDGHEVERRSATQRIVEVPALGERHLVRALETRESLTLVYRWITDGLPFVEERFELTVIDERTTEVGYRATFDPASAVGERTRFRLLRYRIRRIARLRLEGLRALVGAPAIRPRRDAVRPSPLTTSDLAFGSIVDRSDPARGATTG